MSCTVYTFGNENYYNIDLPFWVLTNCNNNLFPSPRIMPGTDNSEPHQSLQEGGQIGQDCSLLRIGVWSYFIVSSKAGQDLVHAIH